MSERNYIYSKAVSTRAYWIYKQIRSTKVAGNDFLKPVVNVAAPFIVMAVNAKTKNPKVGQATANVLKSISGGRVLKLTELQGIG